MSPSALSTALWHAVTPQTRPLSISILELAPTSVTLSLTRSPPSPTAAGSSNSIATAQHVVHSLAHHAHTHQHAHTHPHTRRSSSPASNGGASKKKKKKRGAVTGGGGNSTSSSAQHTPATAGGDSDDGEDGDEDGTIPGAYPSILSEGRTFKDMLSHGVVITVDGMPWSRILAHVSEDAEEDEMAVAMGGGEGDETEWEDDVEPVSAVEEGAGVEECLVSSAVPSSSARRRRGRRPSPDTTRPAKPRPERGARWDRERAVVVVYDLDPAKEHEIELQIIGLAGEVKEALVPVSNAVLIPPVSPSASHLGSRSRANSLRSRSRPRSRSNSVNTAPVPHVPSPLATEVPSSPVPGGEAVVPTSILSPHDAQTAQTRHLIAAAHAERELLHTQIKEARKAAQRSDAALRTEIETLKRSSEKAASSDQRNRQKHLALQEQVKQGWAAADGANKQAEEVTAGMPELEARLRTVTVEAESVRAEWTSTKSREEAARDEDRKSRAEEDKRLADLAGKIDRLRLKKDRKEAERAELHKRLEALEARREDLERRAEEEKALRRQGYYPGVARPPPGGPGAEFGPGLDGRGAQSHHHNSSGGFSAPAFRPRGFAHGQRFPSGGRTAQSPQHGFYAASPASSPAWNPPPVKGSGGSGGGSASGVGIGGGSGGSPHMSTRGTGTNPTAAPFMPGNYTGFSAASTFTPGNSSYSTGTGSGTEMHTALMPPHLQHRIYLPSAVRPRPTPNFHPPPSVLAEQAAPSPSASASGSGASTGPGSNTPPNTGPSGMAQNTASTSSTTGKHAFPPLPSAPRQLGSPAAAGPSLASIVTRAVLSPTGNLGAQVAGDGSGSGSGASGGSSTAGSGSQSPQASATGSPSGTGVGVGGPGATGGGAKRRTTSTSSHRTTSTSSQRGRDVNAPGAGGLAGGPLSPGASGRAGARPSPPRSGTVSPLGAGAGGAAG